MELYGNGERKPSALSRDVSLEEKVNDKPASLSGEITVWLVLLNERELSKPGRAFFLRETNPWRRAYSVYLKNLHITVWFVALNERELMKCASALFLHEINSLRHAVD